MKDKLILRDKTFKPYIGHEEIMAAIDAVAEKVNADFRGCDDVPIVLCVLNGAIPFTGELLQRLDFNCELVSIKMSSYQGTKSTGTVLTMMGLTADVSGRRIIICEDIVDTGNTIVPSRSCCSTRARQTSRSARCSSSPESMRSPTRSTT